MKLYHQRCTRWGMFLLALLCSQKWAAQANGINRNGVGAESMSMGGTGVA